MWKSLMKVTPFETYQTYLSMKSHFTNRKYDFFKYGGKSRATMSSFNKRKDKYWFEKTSRKYSDEEVLNFLLANLLEINLNYTEPAKELEQAIESKFLTPQKFAIEVEKIVSEEQLNYIDAICHYCDANTIDVESVTKLISKPLKEKLKWDATRLNFMKRTSRAKLPL